MLSKLSLNIPEMSDFDQEELDNNPALNTNEPVPLIGALMISEGLISREQLNACLLLQAQDYPNTPIGQILVRCGYISDTSLNSILGLQQELKSSLFSKIEAKAPITADLTALIWHSQADIISQCMLRELGIAAVAIRSLSDIELAQQEHQPNFILLEAALLGASPALPKACDTPILYTPSLTQVGSVEHIPAWYKQIISQFADHIRSSEQHKHAFEQLQQREFEMSAISSMSRSITLARSPHDALVQLMITIRDLFGVEAGTLYRFDRTTQQLIFEVVLGPHQEKLYQQRLSIDRGIAGWVVRNCEPLLIPDVKRDPRFENMFDHQSGFQTRSVLCIPMICMGEVCGVLQLINKLHGDFNERDLLMLRVLGTMGALAESISTTLIENDISA